jgi:hypothetical protein
LIVEGATHRGSDGLKGATKAVDPLGGMAVTSVDVVPGCADARAAGAASASPDVALRRRGLLAAGWAAFVAPFALELLAILRADHVALVERMPDDAFYYLEIGSRLAHGQGFTFDGVHETNGFHPAWQFALVPLARLSSGDALVRAALVLALVCALVAVLLVMRLVARVVGIGPALLGGIVATQFALHSWINGMEGPAVMLAVAIFATALASADGRRTAGRWVVVGLASTMLVLARFDFALVLPIVLLAIWCRTRSWRPVRSWLLGAALLGVPFGTWWLARWHHLLTTSATVKRAAIDATISTQFGGRVSSGYASYLANLGRDYLEHLEAWTYVDRLPPATRGVAAILGLGILALSTLGVVTAISRRRATRDLPGADVGSGGWALGVTLVMLGAKAFLDLLVAPLWATAWYSAPQRLAVGVLVGATAWLGVRRLFRDRAALGIIAIGVVVLVAIPVNLGDWQHVATVRHDGAVWQDQVDLAADWIELHGPVGTYGARDAGLLGERLDGRRDVVNLDGLVNDYRFAAVVVHDVPTRTRIADEHVDYFVGRLTGAELDQIRCGHILWTSPGVVSYTDSLLARSRAHVYVLDTRACLRA